MRQAVVLYVISEIFSRGRVVIPEFFLSGIQVDARPRDEYWIPAQQTAGMTEWAG